MNPKLAIAPALVLLSACSAPSADTPSYEQDVAAIGAFNERYLAAINNEDIAALSALTTEGHIMLMPNRAPIVGKAANDAANGSAFERFDFTETWTPQETEIAGDWAWQRGTFRVLATPRAGGQGLDMTGNFLRIYRRQPNGEWRMIRDMFNSDRPAQGN